jgi:hypothetical protein
LFYKVSLGQIDNSYDTQYNDVLDGDMCAGEKLSKEEE